MCTGPTVVVTMPGDGGSVVEVVVVLVVDVLVVDVDVLVVDVLGVDVLVVVITTVVPATLVVVDVLHVVVVVQPLPPPCSFPRGLASPFDDEVSQQPLPLPPCSCPSGTAYPLSELPQLLLWCAGFDAPAPAPPAPTIAEPSNSTPVRIALMPAIRTMPERFRLPSGRLPSTRTCAS